jgi:hypothetical protein
MVSFRGQASWAKMTSPGGKLTTLVKRINEAEVTNYISTNIAKLDK